MSTPAPRGQNDIPIEVGGVYAWDEMGVTPTSFAGFAHPVRIVRIEIGERNGRMRSRVVAVEVERDGSRHTIVAGREHTFTNMDEIVQLWPGERLPSEVAAARRLDEQQALAASAAGLTRAGLALAMAGE